MTKLSLHWISATALTCVSTLGHAAPLQWSLGDYQLEVLEQHKCAEGIKRETACIPGKVRVANKKLGLTQTLEMEELHVNLKDAPFVGALTSNAKNRTTSIVLSDVNGDSYPDLLFWTGYDGGYGGPSYTAFLYNSSSKRFVISPSFSAITENALGMFTINNGRIYTGSKSGCCTHTQHAYEIRNNEPILVERITEVSGKPDVIERLVNGKMRRVKR